MVKLSLVSTALLTCGGLISGQPNTRSKLPQEIEDVLDMFSESLHNGNAGQLVSDHVRRLEDATTKKDASKSKAKKVQGTIPDINYATVCVGTCWNKIKSAFATAMTTLETEACKTAKKEEKVKKVKEIKENIKKKKDAKSGGAKGSGGDKKEGGGKKAGGGGRLLESLPRLLAKKKSEKVEATCIYDICAKTEVKAMCADTANIDTNYEGLTECKKANILFLCNTVCHADCKDDADVKKLLCGSGGDSRGGKYSNDKGGGGMKSMFNFMCSKNEVADKYCYDMIKTDMAAKKMDKGKSDTKFPDPCEASKNCDGDMGKAITGLGCCFTAFIDAQKKYRIGMPGQVRMAKSIAVACAPDTAFKSCAGGNLTLSKSKKFKLESSQECDAFADEDTEDTFVNTMSDVLNLTEGDVQMLTCQKKGNKCSARRMSDGSFRRMATTGSDVEVDVTAFGDDADAQLATLTTQMNDNTFKSELMTTAGDQATVDLTTTLSGGLVNSAQSGYISSLMLVAMGALLLSR